MLKFLAAIVGLLVLVLLVRTFIDGGAEMPADPITSSANLDLRMHAQSQIQVTIASLTNRMKQVMAAGNEPAQRTALDADLAEFHTKLEQARTQLIDLGDPPAAVDHWLSRINLPEFQRVEAEYRKAGGQ